MTAEEANEFYCAQAARIVDTKGAIAPEDRIEILRRIIASEREWCAKIVDGTKILEGWAIGGTPGPLFDAGWNGCVEEAARRIRGTREAK